MSEQPKDEFEKRQHLTAFITTLVDAITKTSPAALMPPDTRQQIEQAGLKDLQAAFWKKWLDFGMHTIDKIDRLGIGYPIEAILGIKEARQNA